MKKLIGIAFCFGLFVTSGFAEAFIAPHVGFSNMYSKMKYIRSISGSTGFGSSFSTTYTTTHEVSWTPFSGGLDIGLVTKGGFTFLTDLHISTGGSTKYEHRYYLPAKVSSLMIFNLNFLFGYTYKGIKNLYLNFALGLGVGGGFLDSSYTDPNYYRRQSVKGYTFTVGVPIQLGVQYFFTDKIGINLSINDVLGIISLMNIYAIPPRPFVNNFTLKIGPVFRL